MKSQTMITAGVNVYLHLIDVSDAVMHSNHNFWLNPGKKKKKRETKRDFFPFRFCPLWICNKKMYSITVFYSHKKNTVLMRAQLGPEHLTNLKKTFF